MSNQTLTVPSIATTESKMTNEILAKCLSIEEAKTYKIIQKKDNKRPNYNNKQNQNQNNSAPGVNNMQHMIRANSK